MDLKQQLVIWKRSEYLLKNVALIPKLCDLLVDYDLFTADMIAKIQMQKYNVEKTLMMLTLLGSHGSGVYEKFIKALTECNFNQVVKELRRTEKSIKFGEVLPPVFNYFHFKPDFVRQNDHIATRLCEADKHAIQSYIDGKMTVHRMTTKEKEERLEKECMQLRETAEQRKKALEEEKQRIERTLAELETLKQELADSRRQNEQLVESSQADRADLIHYRQLRLEVVRVEAVLRTEYQRQKLQPVIEIAEPSQQQQQQLTRQPTLPPANGEAIDQRKRTAASSDRRNRSKTAAALARLGWLRAQEQSLKDKLFGLQAYKERVEMTAESLTAGSRNMAAIPKVTPSSLVDVEMTFETKTLAAEVGFELRKLMEQMNDIQASISKTRNEITTIEAELSDAELQQQQQRQRDEHVALDVKIRGIVAAMQRHHSEQMAEMEANHAAEIEDLKTKMDRQRNDSNEMIADLRRRLREKMQEVHRRDTVLRKLKRQLGVISRYHAKNMNSQISADESRKIVREIMRDAREVLNIIDKWEKELKEEEEEKEQEESNGDVNKQDEGEAEQIKKKKKKIRHVLDNELLRAIADKLNAAVNQQRDDQKQQQPASSIPIWRQLGSRIDLTPNRLDLVELDAAAEAAALQASIDAGLQPPPPVDRYDLPGYVMLRVWRDEEGGQPDALRMALRDIGRYDMASLVEVIAGLQPMAIPVATTTTTGAPPSDGIGEDSQVTPNAATSTNAGSTAAEPRAPAALTSRSRPPQSTQAR